VKRLIALVLGAVFAVAALSGTAVAAPAAPAGPAANNGGGQNIVEIASSLKRFSTLVDLVVAADLADTLSADGSFTVFAPTNKAFNKLEAAVPGVTAALLDPANKAVLVKVLKYHLLGSAVKSGAAAKLAAKKAKVPTVLGKGPNARIQLLGKKNIFVRDSAGINTAKVVKPFDVSATNGVIHTVNKVLVPKNVAKTLRAVGLL
jgi:uncharacterized surface protein with fasciclin (FAS1) repeats